MMRVTYSEMRLDELGDEIWEELHDRAAEAVVEAAEVVVAAGQQNLRRAKGTKLTASAPGEPPEYDEGELHDSLKLIGAPRRTKYSVRQNYGSEHEGAGLHEWGGTITQDGVTRIYPPRPYLRPAEEQSAEEVEDILDDI